MNKYVYSVCPQEEWPHLETVSDVGIDEAEEKVIFKYCEKYDLNDNNWDYLEFQEALNDIGIVISCLYDIEEL